MSAAPLLTTVQDRAQCAYQIGDYARDDGIITSFQHTLYEGLVKLGLEKGYAWAGESYLAERLRVSVSTVKRALTGLVQAALITRERLGLGRTTLTYVTAWAGVRPVQLRLVEPDSSNMTSLDSSHLSRPSVNSTMVNSHDQREAEAPPTPQGERRQILILDPVVSIERDEPDDRPRSSPSPTPPPRVRIDVPATPATEYLRVEVGVESPAALDGMKEEPVAELRAMVEDLKARGNVRSVAGMIVYLWKTRGKVWGAGRGTGGGPAPEREAQDYLDALREVADETNEASKYFKGDDACEVCGRAVCSCWNSDKSRTDDAEEVP